MLYPFKWTAVSIVGFLLLAVGVIYAARLPDDYACVNVIDDSVSSNNLFLVDANMGITLPDPTHVSQNFGVFSPDQQTYVYLQPHEGDPTKQDLYVVPVSDDTPILLEAGLPPSYLSDSAGNFIRWSQDSQRIAYVWMAVNHLVYLSVVNADGSGKQTMAVPALGLSPFTINNVMLNAWSADNQYLSLNVRGNGKTFLWLWSTNPLEHIPLETDDQTLAYGSWSQSGHAFAAVRTDEPASKQLVFITPSTPSQILQTEIESLPYEQVSWSPDGEYVALASTTQDCIDNDCPLYWRYDFYDRDGQPVLQKLMGGSQPRGNMSGQSLVGTGGTVTLSGHTITAHWQPQGHTWDFVRETGRGDEAKADLLALDVATGLERIITSNVVPDLAQFIFATDMSSGFWLAHSFDSTPAVPVGDHLLIPVWKDSKFAVELTDLTGKNPQVVVQAATALFNPNRYRYFLNSMFWMTPEMAFIIWAQGLGEQTQVRLTAVDTTTNSSRVTDKWFDAISQLRWTGSDWISFSGEEDGAQNLYIFNFATGEVHEVAHNAVGSDTWFVTLNEQRKIALASYQPTGDALSHLRFAPLESGEPNEIIGKGLTFPIWSPDNSHLAVAEGWRSEERHLWIVDSRGDMQREITLPRGISAQSRVYRWTKCY